MKTSIARSLLPTSFSETNCGSLSGSLSFMEPSTIPKKQRNKIFKPQRHKDSLSFSLCLCGLYQSFQLIAQFFSITTAHVELCAVAQQYHILAVKPWLKLFNSIYVHYPRTVDTQKPVGIEF